MDHNDDDSLRWFLTTIIVVWATVKLHVLAQYICFYVSKLRPICAPRFLNNLCPLKLEILSVWSWTVSVPELNCFAHNSDCIRMIVILIIDVYYTYKTDGWPMSEDKNDALKNNEVRTLEFWILDFVFSFHFFWRSFPFRVEKIEKKKILKRKSGFKTRFEEQRREESGLGGGERVSSYYQPCKKQWERWFQSFKAVLRRLILKAKLKDVEGWGSESSTSSDLLNSYLMCTWLHNFNYIKAIVADVLPWRILRTTRGCCF